MRCFFSSEKPGPPEEPSDAVVSFSIPELSITFRARFHGTATACEYAGLLALLEFVEINPQLFTERTLEIFGDSFTVINQVRRQMICRGEHEALRNLAIVLRERIPYTLGWIARNENPAVGLLPS